jgi:hypothetical protein
MINEAMLGRAVLAAYWAKAFRPFESYQEECDCVSCSFYTGLLDLLGQSKRDAEFGIWIHNVVLASHIPLEREHETHLRRTHESR